MKASDLPTAKFPIPWASAAIAPYIRAIPVNSQIGITDGAASLHDGYVPLNFTPRASGGVPPFGADGNGILNQITLWLQWMQAGGTIPWDSTFSTAIAGYPKGCIVESATTAGVYWRSTSDDNVTNPDAAGAGWVQAGGRSILEYTSGTTFATPAGALWLLAEFVGGGGGGGTGDGGSGGSSGTFANGTAGGDTTFNGVVAKGGGLGKGGSSAGNIYGGDGGNGGAGAGFSFKGQGGSPGLWTPTTALGNSGATGGSSMLGGGGNLNNSGAQPGGYGGGGAGGQTGNSGTFSGAGGGGAEGRRVLILRPAASYTGAIGAAGVGGVASGNFPGGNGGPGFLRLTYGF